MAKTNFHLSAKKLLLLGFLFVVLLAIPITVYLVQQQQEGRSQAKKSATLSFNPPTTQAQVGDTLTFDIMLSPGNNQVNQISLVINFDSTKLSATSDSFSLNPSSQLSILQSPVIGTNSISVVLSTGTDPTSVISADTSIGSIDFEVTESATSSTEITFDPSTEINLIEGISGVSENLFLSGNPATVTFQDESQSFSASSSAFSQSNNAPLCSGLSLDEDATGTAPYTITFNVSGEDLDGTISNVIFNFEPNLSEEISSGSGISTNSVDVSATHTYETPGNYTASVVLTDNEGAESDSVNCTASIQITDEDGNIGAGGFEESGDFGDTQGGDLAGAGGIDDSGISSESAETEISPIPPTGPEEAIVGIGVLGGILFLIGILLFMAL